MLYTHKHYIPRPGFLRRAPSCSVRPRPTGHTPPRHRNTPLKSVTVGLLSLPGGVYTTAP